MAKKSRFSNPLKPLVDRGSGILVVGIVFGGMLTFLMFASPSARYFPASFMESSFLALTGVDSPIDVNDANRFRSHPNGTHTGAAWDSYGTYEQHVAEVQKHANAVILYKSTDSLSGQTYYTTGGDGYGTVAGLQSGAVVHCPSGATVEGPHLRSHTLFSPSIEGFYDSGQQGHYWCSMGGQGVNPLPGAEQGVAFPFVQGSNVSFLRRSMAGGVDYYKDSSGQWATCPYGIAGPYGTEQKYYCLNTDLSKYSAPSAGSAPPAPYHMGFYSYSASACVPGSDNCPDTYGASTSPCSYGTTWCQVDTNWRYCSSSVTCPPNLVPPVSVGVELKFTETNSNVAYTGTAVSAGGQFSVNFNVTNFSAAAERYTPSVDYPADKLTNCIWYDPSDVAPFASRDLAVGMTDWFQFKCDVLATALPGEVITVGIGGSDLSGDSVPMATYSRPVVAAATTAPVAVTTVPAGLTSSSVTTTSTTAAATATTASGMPATTLASGVTGATTGVATATTVAGATTVATAVTTAPTGGSTPTTAASAVSTTPKACGPGEKCAVGSWCSNGKQCFYPDSKVSCVDWNSTCAVGTTPCDPSDTNCINPNSSGSLSGWCRDSNECFDGNKKFCAGFTSSGGGACPSPMKYCPPGEANCIEPGARGSLDSYCRNSMECFDGNQKFCNPMPNGNPLTAAVAGGSFAMPSCPDGMKTCKPGETKCTEKGKTNSEQGAWCSGSSKQCFLPNGDLFCAGIDESCPTGAGVCRAGEPNCVENDVVVPLSNNKYCGGSAVQCFSATQMTCVGVSMGDPRAWEKTKCTSGFSRCRDTDQFCLEEGETGSAQSWCASGMRQDTADGKVKCVAWSDAGTTPVVPPPPVDEDGYCLPLSTFAFKGTKCDSYASKCDIPEGWKELSSTQKCNAGLVVDVAIKDTYEGLQRNLDALLSALKDFRLRLNKVPAWASGLRESTDMLNSADKELGLLKSSVDVDPERARKNLEVFKRDTLGSLETRMSGLQVYIDFESFRSSLALDMELRKQQLRRLGQDSSFKSVLSSHITAVEGLLDSASRQPADSLKRIVELIKSEVTRFNALELDQNETVKTGVVDSNIKELAARISVLEKLVELDMNPATEYQFGRLKDYYSEIKAQTGASASALGLQLIDKAFAIARQLETMLGTAGSDSTKLGEESLRNTLSSFFDEGLLDTIVDKVVQKFSDRLSVVLDKTLQDAIGRLASLQSVNVELVAQVMSNLTSVADQYKEQIIEAKNSVLKKLQDVENQLNSASISSQMSRRLQVMMDSVATTNWCGSNSTETQSKLSTLSLSLEQGELTDADLAEMESRVAEMSAVNPEKCYTAGVSPFRDTPTETWYFPAAAFNHQNSFVTGYFDEDGKSLGTLGPANETLRIEALALIMRIAGIPQGRTDVLTGDVEGVPSWGIGYVNGAVANGFVFPDYRMDKPITRLETAHLASGLLADKLPDITLTDGVVAFKDYSTFKNSADVAAVSQLNAVAVFLGSSDGHFYPFSSLLRSEYVTMIQRMVENLGLKAEKVVE